MIIYKKYFFETAHYMPKFKKNHKYRNIHGHSYELIVYLEGPLDKKNQWLIDYEKIDKFVNPLLKKIDHAMLNDIKGLENPTTENLAKWFFDGLENSLKYLEKIEIVRPRIGGCVYQKK